MGSILDHKVIEKNSRLSLAIAKDNLYLFLAIFAIFIFYYLAEPNGVDWSYYSNVKPNYELIYFQREIFSWFLIDIFNNIDKSGILFSSIISSFLMIATYKISHNYQMIKASHVLQPYSFIFKFLSIAQR